MRQLLYVTSLFMVAVLGIAPAALAQTEELSCSDFKNQKAAQAVYDKGVGDANKLDPDGNLKACDGSLFDKIAEAFAGANLGDLAQMATAVFALVALCVIPFQLRREGLRHSADLILQLRNRYHSEEGRKTRQAAAKSIKEARNNGEELEERATERAKKRNDEDELLDFFNRIGLLIQRRALDKSMVASAFYNSVNKYRWANKGYITAIQNNNRTTWEEMGYLHREIYLINKSYSVALFDKTRRVPRGLRWAIKLWRRWKGPGCDDFQGVGCEQKPDDGAIKQFLDDEIKPPREDETERGKVDRLEEELRDLRNWL